jgi:hypothetical protein
MRRACRTGRSTISDQVVADAQVQALGMIQRADSELALMGLPLSFDGARLPFVKTPRARRGQRGDPVRWWRPVMIARMKSALRRLAAVPRRCAEGPSPARPVTIPADAVATTVEQGASS